jgi:predicted ATPase
VSSVTGVLCDAEECRAVTHDGSITRASRSSRFDLTRLRLRDYRSIGSCDVRLGDLTILVGPNGSGKSNILDSLRLTSQALSENLDNALRDRGGIGEVRRRSRGHPSHFGIQVDFRTGDAAGTYGFQIGATPDGDFHVTREECEITALPDGRPRSQQSVSVGYAIRDGRMAEQSEPVMPAPVGDRLYLVAASGIEPFRFLFDALANINVYNLNPDAMRQLHKPESGDLLRRDGSNIASVLERLRRDRPDIKTRIEEYLNRVVDGVTGADRRGFGSWETLEFKQHVDGDMVPWTFQASSMSDGTLRAVGVLTALLAGGEGHRSPVGIEEPESALHPAAAGLLLDALRDASSSRQVLVTTHSPDLLDSPSIGPDELLSVRFIGGRTVVGGLDAAAREALVQHLYTPGELLRVDQIVPSTDEAGRTELFT